MYLERILYMVGDLAPDGSVHTVDTILLDRSYTCKKRDIDEDYLRKTLDSLQAVFPVLIECLTTDVNCLKQRRETEELPLESRLLHNIGSTINLLPKEIFVAIVTCVLQDLPPPDYRLALGKMRMVSVGWNKWIEDTPDLWSVIDFGSWTGTTIQQHLTRSEGAMLSVRHMTYAKQFDREEFREVMVPTISRCHSLNLHLPLDVLPDLAAVPAPALRTARLSFFTDHSTGAMPDPIDLFSSDAPLLENVHIIEVPVRWGSPIFAGLLCLKISGILGNPQVTHLVDILLQCPQLSRLEIETSDIEDDRVTSGQPVPIPLPQLEVLRLQLFTTEVLVFIVENIEALPTRDITIRPDHITDEHLARGLQSAVGTFLTRAKDSLQGIQHVEIHAPTERGEIFTAFSNGLRELHISDGTVDAETFLNMVESRYCQQLGDEDIANEVQAAALALKTVQLPYIQNIVMGSFNYEHRERTLFRKIKQVLGEGVLQFGTSEVGL
ncbi:hypothetical protein FRC01_013863 [Tulasnella sp. 417]|nr:hypothetical protein FRC01_013863 [Tulasnella sp. 417]